MIPPYRFELVQTRAAYQAYLRLRREIFCDEQGLFTGTDEDAWDASAYPIVAVAAGDEVVGVVRIYEAEPGLWYGGRLGVARAHRKQGVVGRGLIHQAVRTAHGWGCRRFLALVQEPNVLLFESLDWRSIERRTHLERVHHLMEANLSSYPPAADPRPAAHEEGWR